MTVTVWINCSTDLKDFANSQLLASNFEKFSWSLHQYFLTVDQNNLGNKIPLLFSDKISWIWRYIFLEKDCYHSWPKDFWKEYSNQDYWPCTMYPGHCFAARLFLNGSPQNKVGSTMRTNLTKLLDLLIFWLSYPLNLSLEFFIMIFFVTNLLNISKFLPPQVREALIWNQITTM